MTSFAVDITCGGWRTSRRSRRCGLREQRELLESRRVKWFFHVERREGSEALGRMSDAEVRLREAKDDLEKMCGR